MSPEASEMYHCDRSQVTWSGVKPWSLSQSLAVTDLGDGAERGAAPGSILAEDPCVSNPKVIAMWPRLSATCLSVTGVDTAGLGATEIWLSRVLRW